MRWLGWLGNAFLLAGALLLGEKSPAAFLMVAIGESLWTVKVIRLRQWDMAFICVMFGGLALRNFYLWMR